MNLCDVFTDILDLPEEDYPMNIPVMKSLWPYTPRRLYATMDGVKLQHSRIVGRHGTIAHWIHKDGVFEFVNFVVDKHTMYFDKVPFEIFWNSFVEARPEIKKELASMNVLDMKQELESLLRDEYEDNYEQYLPELISAPSTVTTT